MGKKSKHKHKPKIQRVEECVRIAHQLRELGIYELTKPYLGDHMNAFIKDGIPSSGSMYCDTIGRVIRYQFSHHAQSHIVVSAES